MEQPSYVLLIACPDRVGLVHHITGVLFRHDLNITNNQEFVEYEHNRFFMRTSFSGAVDPEGLLQEIRQVLPPDAHVRLTRRLPKRVVVLANALKLVFDDKLFVSGNKTIIFD